MRFRNIFYRYIKLTLELILRKSNLGNLSPLAKKVGIGLNIRFFSKFFEKLRFLPKNEVHF